MNNAWLGTIHKRANLGQLPKGPISLVHLAATASTGYPWLKGPWVPDKLGPVPVFLYAGAITSGSQKEPTSGRGQGGTKQHPQQGRKGATGGVQGGAPPTNSPTRLDLQA